MRRVELRTVQSLSEIPLESWQSLERHGNPFLDWRFLQALEETRCVHPGRGWGPCHLTLWEGGELVAAAPAYLKADGMGDFSRDWSLSQLLHQLGGELYPKLVLGVPFSPVTGHRFLVRPGFDRDAAIGGLVELAREVARSNRFASVQVLYHHRDERAAIERAGLVPRVLIQYHWRNRGYRTVDDWLATLPSKRRTQYRRERRAPGEQGIELRSLRAAQLPASERTARAELAHALYRTTTEKYMWGGAYLDRAMIHALFDRLPEHVELVLAERRGEPVAGAINLTSDTHLYGRYWGCFEEHRYLHFNVCLYHSIESCIERSLQVFEGGAGGEHKLARGFDPEPVWCALWFVDPSVQRAMSRVLAVDSDLRLRQIEAYRTGRGLPPAGAAED